MDSFLHVSQPVNMKTQTHTNHLLLDNPFWCYATEQWDTQPRQSSDAVSYAMFIITFHFISTDCQYYTGTPRLIAKESG